MMALDLLFPATCCGCDGSPCPSRAWCPVCEDALGLLSVDLPLEGVRAIYAAAPYDSGVGRAIRRAKYGRDQALMRELGRCFGALLAPVALGADALVPVPSPWTRRAGRGFASAAVLAEALSASTGIPVHHALVVGRGARQAGLSRAGRATNLSGRMRGHEVPGRVILVDDVLTSGATARAAARELLGGASTDVTVAVLASAVQHGISEDT